MDFRGIPPSRSDSLAIVAYNLALLIASPLLLLYLCYRLAVQGKSREGFAQRLGWAPRLSPPAGGGRVWLHAVSAGEVVAAAAIARRLAEQSPETEYVVSTTTPAGQEQARRLLPNAAAHFYFPFDFLPCSCLALLRVRPSVVAAVETEVWPNWLWLARRQGAAAVMVNGQFADRGFRGARRARWLYRFALAQLDALWMQTELARERALFLGANPERTRVVGSVKFEQEVAPLHAETAGAVREALGLTEEREGRPLWIAGSTHPGEEEQVLEAFTRVREAIPGLVLLLAPRHIHRAAEIGELAAARGWNWARRSRLPVEAPVEVLVLDTMGELASLYGLAEVVFVGGSLVPVGGHDVLQPIFQGKPVLFGPHMHNQRDLAALSLAEGAALEVADAASLARELVRLCENPAARREMREAGERLLAKNTGAARECAALLARLAPLAPNPDRGTDIL